ncbi:MAG: hypothetical protein LBP59_10930 [Planctomycetaceae bacterium]|jgi:hypothetical protein|nr:hypothetical protein [Planctomycetaceae bacterium]
MKKKKKQYHSTEKIKEFVRKNISDYENRLRIFLLDIDYDDVMSILYRRLDGNTAVQFYTLIGEYCETVFCADVFDEAISNYNEQIKKEICKVTTA